MINNELTVIAGPCSVNKRSLAEIMRMYRTGGISGIRSVGLKSRTALDPSGAGMGMDFHMIKANSELKRAGIPVDQWQSLPSMEINKEILQNTDLMIATEITRPDIQLPLLAADPAYDNRLLIWNPSVDELGGTIEQMAEYARDHGWTIGIKNGKWIGEQEITEADSGDFNGETSGEKAWKGLVSYATETGVDPSKVVMIHRGFDVPGKGEYRNIPAHELAKRVKLSLDPRIRMFFDPSHTHGPNLRDQIVSETVKAMAITVERNGQVEYLYDGILIEAGTSETDTKQHITIDELQNLVKELRAFRELKEP